jgi:ribosome-associated protein
MPPLTATEKVQIGAWAALEKQANGLVVLDLQGISGVADFFLICSGNSTTQMETIIEAIRLALKMAGIRQHHSEGTAESGWLLLDYGDVVMHVFLDETRQFYSLERLWGDAPLLSVER